MKRFVAFVILLLLQTGCSKSETSSGQGPTAPQKGEVSTASKRYYFSYKDCDYGNLKFEGWNASSAFEVILPDEMNEDIAWKYLEVDFRQGPVSIYKTFATNPIVENLGEFDKYYVLRCKATFFVDIPSTVDLSNVDNMGLNNFLWEEKFDSPIDLKGQSLPGLNSSEIVTAELALKNTPHRVIKFSGEAPAEKAWDLVVLGDGYTESELLLDSDESFRKSKFGLQVQAMVDELFKYKPYDQLKSSINIWVVAVPSKESGTDVPSRKIIKDTFYESSMGAHCVDRAPTVKRGLLALEMAAKTPFDQILMLINSDEYGGSGGTFALSTTTSDYIPTVIHELGHSVGRLADSYYYFSDDEIYESACEDPVVEELVIATESDSGGNGLFPEDGKIAPNLTLNVGGDAKWADLLTTSNRDPVYMTYAQKMGKYDATKNSVTMTMKFTEQFQELIFLGGTDPDSNMYLSQFSRLSIGGVEVPKDKISIEEKVALESTDPLKPLTYRFMKIDLPVPVGVDTEVKFEFAEDFSPDWVDYTRSDANSYKFVSTVFEPSEIGLFQGANPSLDQVFRSSYSSNMMTVGLPHDVVEERAMYWAIRSYTFLELPEKR